MYILYLLKAFLGLYRMGFSCILISCMHEGKISWSKLFKGILKFCHIQNPHPLGHFSNQSCLRPWFPQHIILCAIWSPGVITGSMPLVLLQRALHYCLWGVLPSGWHHSAKYELVQDTMQVPRFRSTAFDSKAHALHHFCSVQGRQKGKCQTQTQIPSFHLVIQNPL